MNYLSIIPRPTGVNVDTPLSFAIYAPIHYNFKPLKAVVDGVTNRKKEKRIKFRESRRELAYNHR